MLSHVRSGLLAASFTVATAGAAAAGCGVTVNYTNVTDHALTIDKVVGFFEFKKNQRKWGSRKQKLKVSDWTLPRSSFTQYSPQHARQSPKGGQTYFFKGPKIKHKQIRNLRLEIFYKHKTAGSFDLCNLTCGDSIDIDARYVGGQLGFQLYQAKACAR